MLRPIPSLALVLGLLLSLVGQVARADAPGGIEIVCDVPRTGTTTFRRAATGQTDVKFKLWSASTGGTQLGVDYTVAMSDLIVAKRHTERYDSVTSRRAARINAVIGSDGSPVLLPASGEAWLDVVVGTTTFGCDYAGTNDLMARKRLQSAAFARKSSHSETCDTCADVTALEARVAQLEALLASASLQDGGMILRFSGVNVQIVSGSGSTNATPNGKGNLIIGYNENDGGDSKTGSHNVVIGENHTYSSYGGFVAGFNNQVCNINSTVAGGKDNVASGSWSAVSGGGDNKATGTSWAVVSGGTGGEASGISGAVVSGGKDNTASGTESVVVGGINNEASANYSKAGGGVSNLAQHDRSVILCGSSQSTIANDECLP